MRKGYTGFGYKVHDKAHRLTDIKRFDDINQPLQAAVLPFPMEIQANFAAIVK
jgi:hypothetical protein